MHQESYKTRSTIKRKVFADLKRLLKRVFPAGSFVRRFYYHLRARYGRFVIHLDRRPPLPIDDDLQRFIERLGTNHASRVFVILATTELVESEGQRSTNLTLELSQRGIPCIHAYWRWKDDYWAPQDRLENGILQVPVDVLASWPEMVFRAIGCEEKILLVEFPHPSFFTLLAEAHACGWIVIYDAVDDWEEFQRVGQATWYDTPFERHLLHAADAVTAINPVLTDHLHGLDRKEVEIIPNGLAEGIDAIDQERELEKGEITVGYFGYLAGAWFDWDLIRAAAEARPSWIFYLIGYGGGPEGLSLPANVIFLGKKPRKELASYASNWDVGIIPFKAERLAAGADPIKTYEYLAFGLPVVITGVHPPMGADHLVRRVEGIAPFLEALEQAAREKHLMCEERKAFARECSWSNRMDDLLHMVQEGAQGIEMKRTLFRRGG
jgi:glycosyltransferase involved in cell wall biosynthesis